jgi:AcrR family transcriptional regulator
MSRAVKRPYNAEHRARVAKLQVEATRNLILDAARLLFERDGYHAATIRAIAAEAEVSEPTVYVHFGSKLALLQALVVRTKTDAEQEELDERYSQSAGAEEMIAVGFRSLRRHMQLAAPIDRVIRNAARAGESLEVDTGLGASARRQHSARVARRLEAEGRLRAGITWGRADDVLYLLSSLEVYENLVGESGWTLDEYEEWLPAAALALLTRKRR